MLQSRSSEKKLVTPLKNCFFWTQFALKRGHYGPRPIWKKIFWQKWQNQIISFQKVFILSKYHNHMFWLSYESFSILSDVFCQKSLISSESSSEQKTDFINFLFISSKYHTSKSFLFHQNIDWVLWKWIFFYSLSYFNVKIGTISIS